MRLLVSAGALTGTPRPQLLPVNQFDHFYRGGDRIGALRHGPGGPSRPEEWIGSTTARFGRAPEGFSALADGSLLVDRVHEDPLAWLGPGHVDRFGTSTELLVKLLDLDQRLPVHLHPSREFARTHLGVAHGKTEAWYVLDAPDGAIVGVGFRDAVRVEQVARWVGAGDSDALLASLQTREVRRGDAMLVPAGLPHSVQAGVFVLELQEPTDLSILLEWQGLAVDGQVDGHLGLGFRTALQTLDTRAISPGDLDALVIGRERIERAGLTSILPARADGYFRAHRFAATTDELEVPAGFAVVLALAGSGILGFDDAAALPMSRGDAAVVPFAAGSTRLRSADGAQFAGVVCRPPATDARSGGT